MYKSQLEPPSENFHETQVFVENIFDTVKKAREAKAARSLAESKLASYDYSFDFSPTKRKKARKNAKNKKSVKGLKATPKKKPRKNAKSPKDSSEKKKKATPTKTPRKYTKRAKVKPQNDIDDEEAAFILSSISQRSFDSFYNRFNGNSIQIPLEDSPPPQQTTFKPPQPQPVSTQNCAYHVLLDHNYWIAEPEIIKPQPKPDAMNLLSTVAEVILSPAKVEPPTTSAKPLEVNNNKLPLLDVNCDTTKCDNAVKKRWLRQATSENTSPVLAVTPPETSPNDLKAPLKKRRIIDEYWAEQQQKDEIKKFETESDQKIVQEIVKNSVKSEIEQNETAEDLSSVKRIVRGSIIVDGRNYSNGFSVKNVVEVSEKKFEPRALNFDAKSSILAQSLTTQPPSANYDPKSSFFGLIPTAYNPTQINFDKLIKFDEKPSQHQQADQHVNTENAQVIEPTPIVDIKSPTKVKQPVKKKEKKLKQIKPKKPKKVKTPKVKKPPKVKQPKISKAKQKKAEKKQNEKLKNVVKNFDVQEVLNDHIEDAINSVIKNNSVEVKAEVKVEEIKIELNENLVKSEELEQKEKIEAEVKVEKEPKVEEKPEVEVEQKLEVKAESEEEVKVQTFEETKAESCEKVEAEQNSEVEDESGKVAKVESLTETKAETPDEAMKIEEKAKVDETPEEELEEKVQENLDTSELKDEKSEPEPVTNDDEYSLDSIKSFDSIEVPIKRNDPVESQVASILEKVIPKTLKEEVPEEPLDDEDDSQYLESVEEFHKDSLEKLMISNRKFCNNSIVQNPFKVEEPQRHSRFDKPLKASLSFESPSAHHAPHFQRSVSEVFNDPRKDRWGNGFYDRRDSYGSFHYDKIHHREPITTTYSMYRAQKAAQMDHRWSSNPVWQPQPEPPKVVNNFPPVTPPVVPQVSPRIVPEVPRPAPVIEPVPTPTTPVTPEPFGGFLIEKLTAAALLPKAKASSSDPRLNPSLNVDNKKDEPSTPKKKLSLSEYRKRQSLTSISTQPSSEESQSPPPSSSITTPTSSLPPAFDPSIVAAAATG